MPDILNCYQDNRRPSFFDLDEAAVKAFEKRPCGPVMNVDIPLKLHELQPNRLYTLSEIFDDKRQKDRVRSMLATRHVEHDAIIETGRKQHPRLRAYWGGTLQSVIPDESWYRAELIRTVLGIQKRLKRRKLFRFSRMVITQPQPQKRPQKWFFVALVISMVLLLAAQSPFFPDIPRLLRTEGIGPTRKALELTLEPKTAKQKYVDAYADYRSGRYEVAQRKIFGVLSLKNLNLSLEGSCHYLLGVIQSERRQYLEGLGSLSRASEIYREIGARRNLYLTGLIMAKTYLSMGYYSEAEQAIDEAYIQYEMDGESEIQHLGWLFTVKTIHALRKKDFSSGLEFATRSVAEYEKSDDNDGLANAYSNLGFSYLLNGELSEGLIYTTRAQDMYFAQQDEKKHIFNLVNIVLLQKFLGNGDVDPYILNRIRGWHRMKQDDEELLFQLDLALNHHSISKEEQK